MKNFLELFVHELKYAFDCETQILKALPELITSASSPKLKEALHHHLDETKKQVLRLAEIAVEMNVNLEGAECNGIRGILTEGHKTIKIHFHQDVKDSAIIAAAQRVEHYEIALYGTLKTYAKHLKLKRVEELLADTLKEESAADKNLTTIAEGTLFTSGVNTKASKQESA